MSMKEFPERMSRLASDTSSKLGSNREEEVLDEAPIVYDNIFVAVGGDFKENKLNLTWAMQHSGGKEIWIVHVLAPPEITPIAGGKSPKIQWGKQESMADDEKERKESAKALDSYIEHCRKSGSRAQTLCVEADSIKNGIITLISQRRIGKLVMGAAAENKYKKNMKELKSEKAMAVFLQAPAFCHIWFVCKGSLVCTRAGVKPESNSSRSPPLPAVSDVGSTPRKSQGSSDESDQFSRLGRSKSAHPFASEGNRGLSPSPSVQYGRSESELQHLPRNESFPGSSSPPGVSVGVKPSPQRNTKNELSNQLHYAMAKADDLKKEIFEAILKGGAIENLYHEEHVRRKELEEDLSKKNEELQVMSRLKSSLQEEIEAYRKERDDLARELGNALSEAERLRHQVAQMTPSGTHVSKFYADFSVAEIAEATRNFNLSMKIGEGGYGNTYKGVLRHTEVAIKVPKPDSSQGPQEFNQEVKVLSRLRHPNIVTLIGVCSEASALIYEYVPNGTLEDRLSCKDGSPPLPWQARIRIARELCCVLIFLQSSQPESIVHGDLKPANILLDSSLSCKLSDFGICHGIKSMASNATMMHVTGPKGTLAYMDPLFLSTGELTAKSDVYSYGIILLQLLTGKPGMNIKNVVQPAFEAGALRAMLDTSAGEWPFELAKRLAALALGCCEMNRRDRPDIGAVWKALSR